MKGEDKMADYKADAQCPFYKGEYGRGVYCEGVMPGSKICNSFFKGAREYKIRHCYEDWEQCRIAKMLWDKYE